MATKKKVKDDTPEAIDASAEVPYEGYSLVQVPAPTKNDFVTNANRRSDDDALHLHACRVIAGDHEGRYGVLLHTASVGKDGYPDEVVMHTFDPDALTITVPYADVRPDVPGRW